MSDKLYLEDCFSKNIVLNELISVLIGSDERFTNVEISEMK